jgi:hypothetical protein
MVGNAQVQTKKEKTANGPKVVRVGDNAVNESTRGREVVVLAA